MEIITKGPAQTKALGKKIALFLKPGDVVALSGQLGGGKTTFLKGLAQGLGVTAAVVSPTFIVNRCYPVDNDKISQFCHFDWYRMNSEADIRSLGMKDYFALNDTVVAIEWADKGENVLPEKKIAVYFKYGEGENERKIIISGIDEAKIRD